MMTFPTSIMGKNFSAWVDCLGKIISVLPPANFEQHGAPSLPSLLPLPHLVIERRNADLATAHVTQVEGEELAIAFEPAPPASTRFRPPWELILLKQSKILTMTGECDCFTSALSQHESLKRCT